MRDEEFSIFFEVICCYHPTEFDSVGRDGLYVKAIHKLKNRPPHLWREHRERVMERDSFSAEEEIWHEE